MSAAPCNAGNPARGPVLLEDVLIDLCMMGADRGALVRHRSETTRHGVMVLLLSKEAMKRIGAALLPVTETMGSPLMDDLSAQPPRDARDTLVEIFAACDRSPHGWEMFDLHFGKMHVLGITFTGDCCPQVAAICTAHGAPCSLDPKKAAPGWEIERREKR